MPALRYRSSIGAAAAAATERIINALRQEGFRAEALGAAELDDALARLGARLVDAPVPPDPDRDGVDVDAPGPDSVTPGPVSSGNGAVSSSPGTRTLARPAARVRWRTVAANPGFLTSYYFSPEDITTVALQQMWALRSDEIVQTTSIWKDRYTEPGGGGPVMVAAIVRTADPQRPPQPPTPVPQPAARRPVRRRAARGPHRAPAAGHPGAPAGRPGRVARSRSDRPAS